jgi:hypothetical protein
MKFLHFFLLLWVIFALLDPDPDSEYGSGSTDLIDPKHTGFKFLIFQTALDDLLSPPGRFTRPPRLVFLLRGLPGSGKSHVAR